jgi:hypothetical protein
VAGDTPLSWAMSVIVTFSRISRCLSCVLNGLASKELLNLNKIFSKCQDILKNLYGELLTRAPIAVAMPGVSGTIMLAW